MQIYGICITISIVLGIIIWIKNAKKFNIKSNDILTCSIYTIISSAIGAKILFLITNIPNNIHTLKQNPLNLITNGFVFYGGIIGGAIGIYAYSKKRKIAYKELLISIIPSIPLMHAIGRIGCFLVGCCYGIPYKGIGNIIYTNSQFAPNNINLFPVQIVESICNLLIFIILMTNYKKSSNKTIEFYCILYGLTRFFLEFVRGDEIRGQILAISTSQWISLILILVGVGLGIKTAKLTYNKL